MCGLLPPTRFSTVVFANAASCVCEAREGGWHAFFHCWGWRGDNQVSQKESHLVQRGLPFTTLILLLLPLKFDVSDAMHRLHRMYI